MSDVETLADLASIVRFRLYILVLCLFVFVCALRVLVRVRSAEAG